MRKWYRAFAVVMILGLVTTGLWADNGSLPPGEAGVSLEAVAEEKESPAPIWSEIKAEDRGLVSAPGPNGPRASEERVAQDNSIFDTRPIQEQIMEPAPTPMLPLSSQTNMDLISRMSFGEPAWHAVFYDSSTSRVYLGMGDTLVAFSVMDPSHPSLLGFIDLGDSVNDVEVVGGYAFVAVNYLGLKVVDVSTPSTMTVTGTQDTGRAYSVAVDGSGSYVYIADYTSGFRVISMGAPGAPDTIVATLPTSRSYDVTLSGSYAYVADFASGLKIFDVSTPTVPVLTGTIDSTRAYEVAVSGSYAYLADYTSGLQVIDVSTPATPTLAGSYDTVGAAYGVTVSGTNAFVADDNGGLYIIDIAAPTAPSPVGLYTSQWLPHGVFYDSGVAYLASGDGGLEVVDVSTPASPVGLSAYGGDSGRDVALSGDLAYVASSGMGVLVVDRSNPAYPRQLARIDTYNALGIALNEPYAYVADYTEGLKIFDVSTPHSPSLIGSVGTSTAYGVALNGAYAYVADFSSGIRTIDISDPSAPALLGTIGTPDRVYGVTVYDNLLYAAVDNAGMMIFDLTNPASPSLLTTFDTPANAYRISVHQDRAYVADVSGGLHILDVMDPTSPWLMSTWDPGSVYEVQLMGDFAYVAALGTGLHVLDVSNPYAPVEVGDFNSDGSAYGVGLADGYAFLADNTMGSYMVHYDGQCLDPHEPNDDRLLVPSVETGVTYDSKICTAGDYDYYRFDLPSGGDLNITMDPPSGSNYNLYLYDSSGVQLANSKTTGDAAENLTWSFTSAATCYVLVRGQDEFEYDATRLYALDVLFTADGGGSCSATPDEAVYIPIVTLDGNGKPVLHIQDPNQPEAVTGYNVYRSDSPTGPWTLLGGDVVDMDAGTANIQYVDLTGDVGGPWYYEAYAYNGVCDAEGP